MKINSIRKFFFSLPSIIIEKNAIGRFLSSLLVPILEKTSITPNQITLFRIFIISFIASVFLSREKYLYNLIGLFLSYLVFLLDSVDGDLARKKSLESKFGEWLDWKLAEPISGTFIILGLSGKLIKSANNDGIFILILLTLVSYIFCKIMITNYEYLSGMHCEDLREKLRRYFEVNKIKPPLTLNLIFPPAPYSLLFIMGFWTIIGVLSQQLFYSFIAMFFFFSLSSFSMLLVFAKWINKDKGSTLSKALINITDRKQK